MLFNSYEFILVFFPVTCLSFFWIARVSHRFAAQWLALASLLFYGWWNPRYVILLLFSIAFNYAMGFVIGHARNTGLAKIFLIGAITANLSLLGYFKYTNFFISTVNTLSNSHWGPADIVLPLGISFFTFTQVAFIVDVYRGIAKEYNWTHYLLFVTYFPHLIAGPVLHHKQMMPQFAAPAIYRPSAESMAIGLTFFTIGLGKKVLLADSFARYATPVFDAARFGMAPDFVVAWVGALSYTFQLYFDFSGYSDMAIGLSLMLGVTLPLNFNSPYRAPNIIEFWRRWHMTLSQFLKDYLYIPLGGNRHGTLRRHVNLLITMILGGLWHGSNWTFVVWGGLHGLYLTTNHIWREFMKRHGRPVIGPPQARRLVSTAITFVAVVVAWVFFRAESLSSAVRILSAMCRPSGTLPYYLGLKAVCLFAAGLSIVFAFPNSQTISMSVLHRQSGPLTTRRAHFLVAAAIGCVFAMSFLTLQNKSEFLYFQF